MSLVSLVDNGYWRRKVRELNAQVARLQQANTDEVERKRFVKRIAIDHYNNILNITKDELVRAEAFEGLRELDNYHGCNL